jgi:hypothetical protein
VAPTIGAMPRVSGKRQAADDEVSETRDHRAWLSGHDPELEWMRAERLRPIPPARLARKDEKRRGKHAA